jgi:hypothetical protein
VLSCKQSLTPCDNLDSKVCFFKFSFVVYATFWVDNWLMPGSVILHKFELNAGGGDEARGGGEPADIESMARCVAAGGVFAACDDALGAQRERTAEPAVGRRRLHQVDP